MSQNSDHHAKMAQLTLAEVYPHYVNKITKKGRTEAELLQVIKWLTSFDESQLNELIDNKASFEEFFAKATLHPNAHLITGVICGYRVEAIDNPVTQKIRYLDKLVDELAKGRKMEQILRK